MMTSTAIASPVATRASMRGAGLRAIALAAGANAILYVAARLAGVSLIFPIQPGAAPSQLSIITVVVVSALGAAAGVTTLALMRRFLVRAVPRFPIVCAVAGAVSLGLPLSLTATGVTTKATLVLMHIAATLSVIAMLNGVARNRQS